MAGYELPSRPVLWISAVHSPVLFLAEYHSPVLFLAEYQQSSTLPGWISVHSPILFLAEYQFAVQYCTRPEAPPGLLLMTDSFQREQHFKHQLWSLNSNDTYYEEHLKCIRRSMLTQYSWDRIQPELWKNCFIVDLRIHVRQNIKEGEVV